MFEGLHSYEKVLLVLGVILFGVLAAALVAYVFQKRGLTTLLPFFVFPVVMIGFPGIQKFSYENGKLEVVRALARVEQNPNDGAARAKLQASVEKIAPRTATDPQGSLIAAKAYSKLGQPKRALEKLDSIPATDPRRIEAAELRTRIEREVHRPP